MILLPSMLSFHSHWNSIEVQTTCLVCPVQVFFSLSLLLFALLLFFSQSLISRPRSMLSRLLSNISLALFSLERMKNGLSSLHAVSHQEQRDSVRNEYLVAIFTMTILLQSPPEPSPSHFFKIRVPDHILSVRASYVSSHINCRKLQTPPSGMHLCIISLALVPFVSLNQ